jgi:hypothetical protein
MNRVAAGSSQTLVSRVRTRLRWAWIVATLQWIAPLVATVGMLLVLTGRVRPWAWPERVALAVTVLALALVLLWAVALRIPRRVAAIATDVGLDTRDAFTTELEIDEHHPFAEAVRSRAAAIASGRHAGEAVPLRWRSRRLLATAAIGGGAIALALAPNHQDEVRAREAREQATLDAIADEVEEHADELEARPAPTAAELAAAEELRSLAEELRRADDLAEAEELARQAEAALRAAVPIDQLAKKTAARGLERSLSEHPLPGVPSNELADAQQQLAAAADAVDGMTNAEREALAQRLEQLAEGQRLGDPDAASALDDAARALRSGATSEARASLGEAARAAGRTADSVSSGETSQQAAAVAARAANRARDAASGRGDGDGDGQGDGDGDGDGDGQGNGAGGGQGGKGQGAQGSPSGNVAGAQDGTGNGQGGQGSSPNAGDSSGEDGPDLSGDGDATDGDGPQIDVGGTPTGDDPGDTVGVGDGPTQSGSARARSTQLPEEYRQRATQALGSAAIPPQLRDVITRYFDCLAGRCATN